MSWGIAETAPEIEKIKSESADYLNGLNSCGVIDWSTYNYAFDFYADLLMKAYKQGGKDAQTERKTGRWIEKPVKEYCSRDCWYPPTNKWDTWNEEEGYWLEDEIFCSECNYHDWQRLKTNFCPNCGADMRGGQDE